MKKIHGILFVFVPVFCFIMALTAAGKITASDKKIKREVKAHLHWDNRIDGEDIRVYVAMGTVTLSGTVSTFFEYHAAENTVRDVRGVAAVKNNLEIQYPPSYAVPSDYKIRHTLRERYKWHPHIDIKDITVSVEGGIVTLRGSVDEYWKKLEANDIAENINGVILVRDNLAIVPTEKKSDQDIGEDIMQALSRNYRVNADSVKVKVVDGVVTLKGNVDDYKAMEAAYDTAYFTLGVVRIKNRLSIE